MNLKRPQKVEPFFLTYLPLVAFSLQKQQSKFINRVFDLTLVRFRGQQKLANYPSQHEHDQNKKRTYDEQFKRDSVTFALLESGLSILAFILTFEFTGASKRWKA